MSNANQTEALKAKALYEKEGSSLQKRLRRKGRVDKGLSYLFLALALLAASSIFFIVGFIVYKGIKPFLGGYYGGAKQSFAAFFTAYNWTYNGNGGMIYLLLTTLYSTAISLLLSAPISIYGALFIARVCPVKLRVVFKSALELLSAIPSVIYGLFGLAVLCPLVRSIPLIGEMTYGGQSIFSASLVLALMSIPTMTLLSYNAIDAVDPSLSQASLALGASKEETNSKVVLNAARGGIFAGLILGIGRALGEATAVQMVIGVTSNGRGFYNPFTPGSTLTSAMLGGMSEAAVDSLGYDVRFSLGIVLMLVILLITLGLNLYKLHLERKMKGRL